MKLPPDEIFAIVLACPLLDKIEVDLRVMGQIPLADSLKKLQEDAGVAYEADLRGEVKPVPGARGEELKNAYEDVTQKRVSVLAEIHNVLPAGARRDELQTLMDQFDHDKVPAPQPAYRRIVGKLGGPQI